MYSVNLGGTATQSLVSIGTNISSENASIQNASVNSLSVVEFKTAVFSPHTINTSALNVSSINLDPNFVFPVLNVSTLNSTKESFVNMSVVNISANQITADNIQPLLTAGDNINISNNVISALNNNLPATGNFSTLNTIQINASNLSTGDLTFGSNFSLNNKFLTINSTTNITQNSGDLITSGAVFEAFNRFGTNISDGRSLINIKLIEGGDVIKPIVPGTTNVIDVDVDPGTSKNIMKVFYTTKLGQDANLGVVANFAYVVSGNGFDKITARLEYNDGSTTANIGQAEQIWADEQGGGTRSGVLSPRIGTRRSNVPAQTQVYFQIIIQNDSNDTFTFLNPDACTFQITESLDNDGSDLNLNTGIIQANAGTFNSLTVQPGSGSGRATIGKTYLGNNAFSNMASLSVIGNTGATNYGFAQIANHQTVMNAQPGSYNSFRSSNNEIASINNIGLGIGLGVNNTAVFPIHVSGDSLVTGTMFTTDLVSDEADITDITNLNLSGANATFQEVNISGNLVVNGTTFTNATLVAGENINISNNVISAFFGSGGQVNLNHIQVDGGVDIGGVLNVSQTSNFSNSLNVGDILYVGEAGNHEGSVVLYSNIVGDNYTTKINSSTLEVNSSATGNLSAINYFIGNNRPLRLLKTGIETSNLQAVNLTTDTVQTIGLEVADDVDIGGVLNVSQTSNFSNSLNVGDILYVGEDGNHEGSVVFYSNNISDNYTTKINSSTLEVNSSATGNLSAINFFVGNNKSLEITNNGIESSNLQTGDIRCDEVITVGLEAEVFACIDGEATFRFSTPQLNATNASIDDATIGEINSSVVTCDVLDTDDLELITLNVTTANVSTGTVSILGVGELTSSTIETLTLEATTLVTTAEVDATLVKANVIKGNNLSTATMFFTDDFIFDSFSKTLRLTTNASQIIGYIENNGLVTSSVNTSSLSVDGFVFLDIVAISVGLNSTNNNLFNINSSGTANISEINNSTINSITTNTDFFKTSQFLLSDQNDANFSTSIVRSTNTTVTSLVGDFIFDMAPNSTAKTMILRANGTTETRGIQNVGTIETRNFSVDENVSVTGSLSALNAEIMNDVDIYNNLFVAGTIDCDTIDATDVLGGTGDFPLLRTGTANSSTINSSNGNFSSIVVNATGSFQTVVANTVNVAGTLTANDIAGYQEELTAGSNISIVNNVISAIVDEFPSDANFSTVTVDDTITGGTLNTSFINTSFFSCIDEAGFSGTLNGNIISCNELDADDAVFGNIAGFVYNISDSLDDTESSVFIRNGDLTEFIHTGGRLRFSCNELQTNGIANFSTLNASNLSTSGMKFTQDFTFDAFSKTLSLSTSPEQAIADIETNGLTTTAVNTSSLNVDGITSLDVVAISLGLSSTTNNLFNINSSGTANISEINNSTINSITGNFSSVAVQGTLGVINATVADTLNVNNIPGFQKTLVAGDNMSIVNNVVYTLPDVNFSTINSSVIIGDNLSTSSISFDPTDFNFVNDELSLATSASQIETNTIETIKGGLTFDAFSTLDGLFVVDSDIISFGQSLDGPTSTITTMNSSTINSSVIIGDNLSTSSISFKPTDFNFSNGELSLVGGGGGSLPADANFSSVTADVGNFSSLSVFQTLGALNATVADTLNVNNIPGFQKTVVAGDNMSIVNNVVYTLPDVNFSTITAEVGNFSTINTSDNVSVGGTINVGGSATTTEVLFDTVLLRRLDNSDLPIQIRTIQIFVNDTNILPSATSATQSTGIVGNPIGDVIEFITWDNLQIIDPRLTDYASNVRLNNVVNDFNLHSDNNPLYAYPALYIPLTQSYNVEDIQSILLYNRVQFNSSFMNGFRIELYDSSNGFTPGTNILYEMPITTTAFVYRFDLPAISTYSGEFSTGDSTTQIKDITVSPSTQNVFPITTSSASFIGSLESNTINVSTINASSIVGYQETLIAGSNISIVGNTISSTGGGTSFITNVAIAKINSDGTNIRVTGCTVSRTATGRYTLTFDTAQTDNDYVVQLTVAEPTNTQDDAIITFDSGTALTTGFSYSVTEQDNGTNPGAYIDRAHFVSVLT